MRQAICSPASFIFMAKFYSRFLLWAAVFCAPANFIAAQSPEKPAVKPAAADPSAAAQQGLHLAEEGRCREALPVLKKSAPQTSDKSLKLKLGLATVRCGQLLNQTDATVTALLWLNREFSTEPEVLYVTTHAFSDLATRAALQLANTAPNSKQARELNAEALEMQGKWDEAAAEYNAILKQAPDTPGMHYRIGRAILSKPPAPTTVEDARKEFEAELKIDPRNAGAEFILGQLARQAQQWDEAIEHFSRAVKLDPNFADAFMGLGFSLNAASRFAEAIPPLETAVKMQPDNPAGHYQLAMAYNRMGRREDAKREAQLQKEAAERAEQARQKAAGPPQ
jgi:tetratricopeptide (TPR) repeat protein